MRSVVLPPFSGLGVLRIGETTKADAANLPGVPQMQSRINAYMTALGINVY
jgi:hypothetical protein